MWGLERESLLMTLWSSEVILGSPPSLPSSFGPLWLSLGLGLSSFNFRSRSRSLSLSSFHRGCCCWCSSSAWGFWLSGYCWRWERDPKSTQIRIYRNLKSLKKKILTYSKSANLDEYLPVCTTWPAPSLAHLWTPVLALSLPFHGGPLQSVSSSAPQLAGI